jgi:hypothetical protein
MSATVVPFAPRPPMPSASWNPAAIAELARWDRATVGAEYFLMSDPIDDTDRRAWLVATDDGTQYICIAYADDPKLRDRLGVRYRECALTVFPEGAEWTVVTDPCGRSAIERFTTLREALEGIVKTL